MLIRDSKRPRLGTLCLAVMERVQSLAARGSSRAFVSGVNDWSQPPQKWYIYVWLFLLQPIQGITPTDASRTSVKQETGCS